MKRLITALLVAALCLSLCSCGYNPETVGKVIAPDGTEYDITCGRYLAAQFNATDSAAYSMMPGTTPEISQVLDGTISGVPARDWIAETTEEILIRAAAVDRLYDELGLSVSAEQLYIYEYSIGYGWNMYYDIYMKNGIGYDSFYDVQMNKTKDGTMYQGIYGAGGPEALDDGFIRTFIEERAARACYFVVTSTPVDTGKKLTDEELARLDELAVLVAAQAEKTGLKEAVEKYKTEYEDILGQGALDKAFTESSVLFLRESNLADAIEEKLFAAKEGEIVMNDNGMHSYIILQREALTEEDGVEGLRNRVVESVGTVLYEEYIKEYLKGWTIQLDPKAVKYYSVDKVTFK